MPQRVAYLTIDDAPSPLMPEKVEYLSRRGIPAVWFCQGNYLEQRPDFVLQAIRRGFLVGNHSFDHPHFSDLELPACLEQITRTDRIIERLHHAGGRKRYPKYFRFPYGDKGGTKDHRKKEAIQDVLKSMGYIPAPSIGITYGYYNLELRGDTDWYWTYDVMDWSINAEDPQSGVDSIEKVLARMDENDPEGGKGLNAGNSAEIVLVHDHKNTSQYFTRIIERLMEKGVSFLLPVERL